MRVLSVVADMDSGFSMLLTDADQKVILPVGIGQFEAQSIALAVQGEEPPRPLTHDLLKSVCDSLGAAVEKVVITDTREGVFYAEVHLQQDGRSLVLDSRPGDAVALAVRCGCPIYMSPKLVEFTYKFEDIVAQE